MFSKIVIKLWDSGPLTKSSVCSICYQCPDNIGSQKTNTKQRQQGAVIFPFFAVPVFCHFESGPSIPVGVGPRDNPRASLGDRHRGGSDLEGEKREGGEEQEGVSLLLR